MWEIIIIKKKKQCKYTKIIIAVASITKKMGRLSFNHERPVERERKVVGGKVNGLLTAEAENEFSILLLCFGFEDQTYL